MMSVNHQQTVAFVMQLGQLKTWAAFIRGEIMTRLLVNVEVDTMQSGYIQSCPSIQVDPACV
jgi:hypothetical protein